MTDVIEDAQLLLQWTIDYLTVVLNRLRENIRNNSHRPLNRRTLVRWLAAFFPKPRDPKLYLQTFRTQKDHRTLQRWSSTGSLQSALSAASVHRWLEEDLGQNFIHFRRASFDEAEDEDGFEGSSMSGPRATSPILMTSTPNRNFSSASSVSSELASERMTEMEEELAALRKQIALLVIAQEAPSINKTITAHEEGEAISEASHAAELPLPMSPQTSHDDSGCESETVRAPSPESVCPAPPAPPPPPPPPPPLISLPVIKKCSNNSHKSDVSSFADLIKNKKSQLLSRSSSQPERESVTDMAHVLRDLGSVKLKPIQRSPGGTPMRRKPKVEATDPASIIALALKKKFAQSYGHSPESDKENDTSSFFSDSSPFGPPKIVKKGKRRLSLFEEDSRTPVASPLKTLNI